MTLRLLTLLLVACGPIGPDTGRPVRPSSDNPTNLLITLLEQDHFVQEGAFVFSDYAGCCEPDARCLGNNPTTPYGTYALPNSPGQTRVVDDFFSAWGELPKPELNRTFMLRADEAIVFVGTLPPRARYLGLRSYLATRVEPDNKYAILGSLGPSLNQYQIAEERGVAVDEIWGQPIVVVTTADAAVEAIVHEQLHRAGFDMNTVHNDRIPLELVRMGVSETDDTFEVTARVGVPDDPAAEAAWRADPGATLLRVSPRVMTAPVSPHPWPELPPRGTGSTEDGYTDAVEALRVAIKGHHATHDAVTLVASPVHIETLTCIANRDCAGDIHDRFAAIRTNIHLFTDDEFIVVFGVNHERSGKASYSNFAVVREENLVGIDAVHSGQMPGSAQFYLPDHPQADDLYAWTVARDCSTHAEACMELGTTCPSPDYDQEIRVTVRAYLEPQTGSAPLSTEMIGDRIMKLEPLEN